MHVSGWLSLSPSLSMRASAESEREKFGSLCAGALVEVMKSVSAVLDRAKETHNVYTLSSSPCLSVPLLGCKMYEISVCEWSPR